MLSKGQKTNVYIWRLPTSFSVGGELLDQPFTALVIFSAQKDDVCSLGTRYGHELSEVAGVMVL